MNFWTALLPQPPRERRLTVEAGEVVCPRRGITDVETCFICPSFRRLAGEEDGEVTCVPRGPISIPFLGVPR